jgi:hypothetical protein
VLLLGESLKAVRPFFPQVKAREEAR